METIRECICPLSLSQGGCLLWICRARAWNIPGRGRHLPYFLLPTPAEAQAGSPCPCGGQEGGQPLLSLGEGQLGGQSRQMGWAQSRP